MNSKKQMTLPGLVPLQHLSKKYKARETIAPQALYQSFYLYKYTKKSAGSPSI